MIILNALIVQVQETQVIITHHLKITDAPDRYEMQTLALATS